MTVRTSSKPKCPQCQSSMVLRTAQRGPRTGKQFWGCGEWPRCEGTRDFTPGGEAVRASDAIGLYDWVQLQPGVTGGPAVALAGGPHRVLAIHHHGVWLQVWSPSGGLVNVPGADVELAPLYPRGGTRSNPRGHAPDVWFEWFSEEIAERGMRPGGSVPAEVVRSFAQRFVQDMTRDVTDAVRYQQLRIRLARAMFGRALAAERAVTDRMLGAVRSPSMLSEARQVSLPWELTFVADVCRAVHVAGGIDVCTMPVSNVMPDPSVASDLGPFEFFVDDNDDADAEFAAGETWSNYLATDSPRAAPPSAVLPPTFIENWVEEVYPDLEDDIINDGAWGDPLRDAFVDALFGTRKGRPGRVAARMTVNRTLLAWRDNKLPGALATNSMTVSFVSEQDRGAVVLLAWQAQFVHAAMAELAESLDENLLTNLPDEDGAADKLFGCTPFELFRRKLTQLEQVPAPENGFAGEKAAFPGALPTGDTARDVRVTYWLNDEVEGHEGDIPVPLGPFPHPATIALAAQRAAANGRFFHVLHRVLPAFGPAPVYIYDLAGAAAELLRADQLGRHPFMAQQGEFLEQYLRAITRTDLATALRDHHPSWGTEFPASRFASTSLPTGDSPTMPDDNADSDMRTWMLKAARLTGDSNLPLGRPFPSVATIEEVADAAFAHRNYFGALSQCLTLFGPVNYDWLLSYAYSRVTAGERAPRLVNHHQQLFLDHYFGGMSAQDLGRALANASAAHRKLLPLDLYPPLTPNLESNTAMADASRTSSTLNAPETPKKRRERTPALDQAKLIGGAVADGLGMAAVDQVGEVFITMARKLAGDSPFIEPLLASPEGREAIKLLLAVSFHTTAETAGGILPGGEHVARAARAQTRYSTAKLASAGMTKLSSELALLVTLGKQLEQLEAPREQLAANAIEDAEEILEGSDAERELAPRGRSTPR